MSSIILEAKSLTKEYKQTLALDHINLQIKKGKIYGFIGQNGAGKTRKTEKTRSKSLLIFSAVQDTVNRTLNDF